jgi:preprotein translocase subunit SecY
MKGFIDTIKSIWSVKELRNKIYYTLILLFIYRLGTHIVLPGIDLESIKNIKTSTEGGLLGLFNMFAGGAFAQASIFGLGVMPYISASIAMQLLGFVIPSFKKLQMEGESGRRTINQYTRYLTILFTLFQGAGYITFLRGLGMTPAAGINLTFFTVMTMFVLTSGTLFVVWLGERITERGLGNGVSIIIMAGIIARLPIAFINEFQAKQVSTGGLVLILMELLLFVAVIMVTILVLQATRKVAVQYARRIVEGGGMSVIPGRRQAAGSSAKDEASEVAGSVRQYLPLKLNTAGVMPIIFAQAVMFLPSLLAQFKILDPNSSLMINLTNPSGWVYNLVVFLMVVVMTFLYTAIVMSPSQMADDLKRNNGFIPGVKPGSETADYLDMIISRITLPGSIFLGLIAIFPFFVTLFLKVDQQWASFYGGTSLLIAIGVILDTIMQVDGHLANKKYDGLTDYNKLQSRQFSEV